MNTRKFNGNAREHQPPWEHGGFWKRVDRERREEMKRESEIMKTETITSWDVESKTPAQGVFTGHREGCESLFDAEQFIKTNKKHGKKGLAYQIVKVVTKTVRTVIE